MNYLPWYPIPPYRNEGWKILNSKGELVATFEAREECDAVCQRMNELEIPQEFKR